MCNVYNYKIHQDFHFSERDFSAWQIAWSFLYTVVVGQMIA